MSDVEQSSGVGQVDVESLDTHTTNETNLGPSPTNKEEQHEKPTPNNSLLPAEILCDIFIILILHSYPHVLKPGHGRTRWTAVTHVCSFWRQAALAYPALWVDVYCDVAGMALAFLERSRGQLIDVGMDHGEKVNSSVTKLLSNRVDDLRQLRIWIPNSGWESHDWVFGASSAPNLEVLILKTLETSALAHSHFFILPFHNNFPKLEKLSLTRVSIPWVPLQLYNLRSFKLQSIGRFFQPTAAQLLVMLASSPLLEYLYLQAAGPRWSPNDEDAIAAFIHLPLLRDVIIDTIDCGQNFSPVRVFLSHLTIHENPYIQLQLYNVPIDDVKFTNFLPPHLQPSSNTKMCKASIYNSLESSVDIAFRDFETAHWGQIDARYPCHNIILHADCSMTWPTFVRLMQSDHVGKVAQLETLCIACMRTTLYLDSDMDDWRNLLRMLTGLRKLKVEVNGHGVESSLPGMLRILAELEGSSISGDHRNTEPDVVPTTLSNLSTLDLLELTSTSPDEEFFPPLRAFLRCRFQKGLTLQRLVVTRSQFPDQYLREIRPLVTRLQWGQRGFDIQVTDSEDENVAPLTVADQMAMLAV